MIRLTVSPSTFEDIVAKRTNTLVYRENGKMIATKEILSLSVEGVAWRYAIVEVTDVLAATDLRGVRDSDDSPIPSDAVVLFIQLKTWQG
ncbi:hypothetical protein TPY_2753 [Sulfobacillus acidophilus TPY]|uniref:Uncharacterized protein n=1 Tax=Sulfobacillus acidophilus (strain ATCC 700253 / DSM 10332 / NAL) TaxID=679936 RepID=G8TUI0_SULAD|nr:hypothetical protein TPY_2753 [Sulfobacillus acidophilus TPY]AEW04627.1 hypothetical protein Sulac_1127 [Sulfobacillus acidophilus DSM 10332]